MTDYLIVGGGSAGCVLAARLIGGVRRTREILSQPTLRHDRTQERVSIWCPTADTEIKPLFHNHAHTVSRSVGTRRMGQDPLAMWMRNRYCAAFRVCV